MTDATASIPGTIFRDHRWIVTSVDEEGKHTGVLIGFGNEVTAEQAAVELAEMQPDHQFIVIRVASRWQAKTIASRLL